jgi:hypothetical protein
MKKEILSLVLISMLFSVSAQEISLDYPKLAVAGEEFNVGLTLTGFKDNIYDIKIEILDGDKNIAKRYQDGEWKSTYYWMNKAIELPDTKEGTFLLKVSDEYSGEADIKVKVRSGKSSKEFTGYKINIIPGEKNKEEEGLNENNKEDEKKLIEKTKVNDEKMEVKEEAKMDIKNNSTEEDKQEPKENVIHLGKGLTKKEENIYSGKVIYESKNQLMKKYSLGIFSAFLMIFGIWIAGKKILEHRRFFKHKYLGNYTKNG